MTLFLHNVFYVASKLCLGGHRKTVRTVERWRVELKRGGEMRKVGESGGLVLDETCQASAPNVPIRPTGSADFPVTHGQVLLLSASEMSDFPRFADAGVGLGVYKGGHPRIAHSAMDCVCSAVFGIGDSPSTSGHDYGLGTG